ncbi:MAG: FAD-dependent oxidoreductase [Syntrophales bacterium]|nr:FAD-dependent oxidoreductase [Syntrophales bacterium]MDD4339682.1 FAD-dependent oxidoreductase [Syntrophales bacterium]
MENQRNAKRPDVLLEPIRINGMVIPNRILMPAMHLSMVQNSFVTDQLVEFYAERARGGAGAFVAGYGMVNDDAGSAIIIGAHRDEFLPGLSRLAEAMKLGGGRAGLQLNHSGRYNFSILLGGRPSVAPSAIRSQFTKEEPRALATEEVRRTVQDFADTARRARKAGFDFVEILSGTGYLISQFLSELTNRRTDAYGGSWENRMRFGLEIARAVREAVGADYPVLWRINGNDFMPGGIGRMRMREYAVKLVENGADAISVNVGWHESRVPQIITQVPRGAFAYLARGIREQVGVPVIAGHRINDLATARAMIADHMCDMVGMGRALIADPDLPRKIAAGRENEIIHCVACAQGCFDHLFNLQPVECLCNPRAGHESERGIEAAPAPRKVLVIGGGPAGMTAAATAAQRGHRVTLCEKEEILGGQLLLAGLPPGRDEFQVLARDLEAQLAAAGVAEVRMGVTVDEAFLDRERPDAVILATGAEEWAPPLDGADLPHVVGAWDVLRDRVQTGPRVVIIGGGAVGVETALFLAEKGTLSGDMVRFLLINRAEPLEDLYELATRGTKDVTLVEMLDRIGPDIGRSTRWGMLQDLDRHHVKTLAKTRARAITPTAVVVEDAQGTREIPADSVVLALGSRSYNPLEVPVRERGLPYQVIGDARKVAKALDAIHEGFEAGARL